VAEKSKQMGNQEGGVCPLLEAVTRELAKTITMHTSLCGTVICKVQ
jgi:hypothetical protein